jgi:glutamate--cysteine ligase
VSASTLACVDVFLLHCLLADSPPDCPLEIASLARNQERTAAQGREPGVMLECCDGGVVGLQEWGLALIDECEPIAQALDAAVGSTRHLAAVRQACESLESPSGLPSARVLQSMARDHDNAFNPFARARSAEAGAELAALPWPAEAQAQFEAWAQASRRKQAALEAQECVPFEEYRQHYVSAERLTPSVA